MEHENLVPAADFCRHSQIEITFLQTLQEHGLVRVTTVNETHFIDAEQLHAIERLARLHRDLSINVEGLDAVMHLLHQLDDAQAQLAHLRNRLRFYEHESF